jgi:hypothetical protein
MSGDIERLLAVEPPRVIAGAADGIRVIGLGLSGRRDEARRKLLDMRHASRVPMAATRESTSDRILRSAMPAGDPTCRDLELRADCA